MVVGNPTVPALLLGGRHVGDFPRLCNNVIPIVEIVLDIVEPAPVKPRHALQGPRRGSGHRLSRVSVRHSAQRTG